MRFEIALVLALAGATAVAADRYGDWWVAVPSEVMKTMTMSERTCADRATKALENNNPRSAAAEWKRFNSEFLTSASEEALAWASFFQAYSLDKAKDRFKAIDLYSETMELYPDSKASCAAQFFRGVCQGSNGQALKENADYQELVDNQAYANHPLIPVARNRLAGHYLRLGKLNEAMREWQTVIEGRKELNPLEWNQAKRCLKLVENLADLTGNLTVLAAVEETPDRKIEHMNGWRNWLWNEAWRNSDIAVAYFKGHLGKAKDVNAARCEYLKRLAGEYSKIAAPVYRAAGREWDLLLLDYDACSALGQKEVEPLMSRIAAALQKTADAGLRSARAENFIAKLRDGNRITEAKLLLDQVQDPLKRAWLAASIGWRARDGAFIVKSLQVVEASPDGQEADRAKRDHAKCCKEILRDYDAAIRLYEEAPQPPGTLWAIAECHRAAGRTAKAQAMLDEICGIFPNDAANAMLRKGDWYKEEGDKKKAIGCYRRILSHQDWKKTGAASQAHQRLEAFGIGTGGAVLNEVH